jgi:hypothetical protein
MQQITNLFLLPCLTLDWSVLLLPKKNTNEKSNLLEYEERKHRCPRRHKSVWSWSQHPRHPACYTHGDSQKLIVLGSRIWSRWRDGHQAHSYVMLGEYQDMKKFQFWTTSGSQEKIETLHEDYVQIWEYLSAAFTGSCLCHFIFGLF